MSLIDPPEGVENADDELIVGDAHGTGFQLHLLADGRVRREFAHHTEIRRNLDPIELTQVVVRLLRRQTRMVARILTLEDRVQTQQQQLQTLNQRVTALENP